MLLSLFAEVCLLRLDFLTFQTLGTGGTNQDNEGDCMDMFTVTVCIEYFLTFSARLLL